MEVITKESYRAWLTDSVTEYVRHELKALVYDLEHSLGLGQTLVMESAEETHGLTAGIVGRISGINDFLDFGDRFESEDEEETQQEGE